MPSQVIVDGDGDFWSLDPGLQELVRRENQPDEAKEDCDYSQRSTSEHV